MPAQAAARPDFLTSSTTIWLKCRREARKFKPAALALPGGLRFEQSRNGSFAHLRPPLFSMAMFRNPRRADFKGD